MTRTIFSTRAAAMYGAALALSLLLAGCGGDNQSTDGTGSGAGSTANSSSPDGTTSSGPVGTPAAGPRNDADIGFATGMVPHHAQAVEMADLLFAKDDIDPAVTQLAEQIKDAQGPEIEQMSGWLAGWGAPVPSAEGGGMDGMDHSESGGSMPGMMSNAEMAALEDASGADAEKLFLEQMITHHLGAVEMAKSELRDGENRDATQLAQTIIASQESEIASMTELLGS